MGTNYEGKLGEWLKYVQQQIEAAGTKNKEEKEEQPVESTDSQSQNESVTIERIRMIERGVMPEDVMDDVDSDAIIADIVRTDRFNPIAEDTPTLFDEEIPQVEEFLPFLAEPESRTIEKSAVPDAEIEIPIAPTSAEGTGTPRPIVREEHFAETEQPKPIRKRTPKKRIETTGAPVTKEIAQKSYKPFKETREQLIARLVDPILTLEETARLLNVCPTTVRRYTNRGVLKHIRTAGNQRRFRLSDVIAFIEQSNRGEL